jgi:hypothetical protein
MKIPGKRPKTCKTPPTFFLPTQNTSRTTRIQRECCSVNHTSHVHVASCSGYISGRLKFNAIQLFNLLGAAIAATSPYKLLYALFNFILLRPSPRIQPQHPIFPDKLALQVFPRCMPKLIRKTTPSTPTHPSVIGSNRVFTTKPWPFNTLFPTHV